MNTKNNKSNEVMIKLMVKKLEEVIKEKRKKARGNGKKVIKVVEEIKKVEVWNLRGNEWEIEEKLILKKGKVYVLKNKELKIEII